MPSIADTNLLTTYSQRSLADSGVSLTGLVGYWKLDGDATDSSGSGNNGTASNITYPNGVFNQGALYNGTSAKIAATAIDAGSGSITVSCWSLIDTQVTNYPQIIANGATTLSFNIAAYGTAYAAGDRQKVIFFAQNSAGATVNSSVTGQMNDGRWHHYVGVVNATTGKIALYLDGALVGTEQTFTGTLKTPAGSLFIGTGDVPGSANQWFKGNIDDVAIWTRALDATEIAALYKAGGACVGYWKLDQTEDTNTKLLLHFNGEDTATSTIESSTGKAVTFVGTAQIDTAQKKFGSASLLLDGNSDYLTLVDTDDWYFGTGNFTIDLWVRFASLTGVQYLAGQLADANNYWQFAKDSDNSLNMYFKIGGVIKAHYYSAASAVSSIDTWYHIALVRNSTNVSIYVNGTSISLTPGTAISTNDLGNVASVLNIGQLNAGGYVNGWIDEFRIVKGVAKWTTNFTPPTTPYSFQTDDYSANGYHLVTGTQPANTTGLYGQAGDFEKDSSQYITIADATAPNLEISGSQTWTCWFKPESEVIGRLMGKWASAGGNIKNIQYDGGVSKKVIFALSGLTTNSIVTSTQTLSAGNWYFIAGVYDSTNQKLKIWINGEKTEVSASGSAADIASGFSIGRPGDRAVDYTDGIIDDVAIFNRALTDDEIYEIYLFSRSVTDTSSGSDNISLSTIGVSISDSATDAESAYILNKLSMLEEALGEDSVALFFARSIDDYASGSDLVDVLIKVGISETGSSAESIYNKVELFLQENGICIDSAIKKYNVYRLEVSVDNRKLEIIEAGI